MPPRQRIVLEMTSQNRRKEPRPNDVVCLRAEEYAGRAPVSTERCVPARTGWRRVKLDGITTASRSKIVFSIHVMSALGGKSFDVDSIRLTQS